MKVLSALFSKPLLRYWPYALLFRGVCAFYAFFLARSVLELGAARIGQWAAERSITLTGREIELFPPGIRIASLKAPLAKTLLEITDIRISASLFPPACHLLARALGGTLNASFAAGISLKPKLKDISFAASGISLNEILNLIPEKNILVTRAAGEIACSGGISLNYAGGPFNWRGAAGNAHITLKNGGIGLVAPFFKKKELAGINGEAKLLFNGPKCIVKQCLLRSGNISLDMKGSLSAWLNPAISVIDVKAELRVPPEELNENLMPRRSMARFKKHGAVTARIKGTISKPLLQLEN